MSATINWRVGTMECYPQYQQEKDVVFTVHWDCLGSEEYSGSTYTGRVYGSNGVTYHGGDQFIPYEDLTEATVLGWIWDEMGQEQKDNIESSVQNQINNQINPPIVILPLPWSAPSITSQPQSLTVATGSIATFTVSATGKPTPMYQWYKGNVEITDATSNEYTIQSVTESDYGTYTVTVSNSYGNVTSNPAELLQMAPTPPTPPSIPTITVQPISQTVVVGDGVTFNVNAIGDQPLSYQWYKDNSEMTGGTGNTLIIQTVSLTDAGEYKAIVTNQAGIATSDIATLTVTE